MKNQFFKGFKTFIAIAIMVMYASMADAQVAITDDAGGATADPTAVLDLQSTTKGFLLSRMTDAQRLAIPSPAIGLLVANDVTGNIYIYTSAGWALMTTDGMLTINNLTDAKSNTNLNSYYIGDSSGINADNNAIDNTAIGSFSGSVITTGQKNTAIGAEAGVTVGTLTHTTALGYNAKANASFQVVLGTMLETVIIPNKLRINSQLSAPAGNEGELYVETADKGLYYHDGTSWERIDKQGSYAVGDWALGGVVFYVDETGQHGLVCSAVDLASARPYSPNTNDVSFAQGDGLYAGQMNTNFIVSQRIFTTNPLAFAAWDCAKYNSGVTSSDTYGDWYLPSQYELNLMYLAKATINTTIGANAGSGLSNVKYWSSTENNGTNTAYTIDFNDGSSIAELRTNLHYVRAVRKF